MFIETYDQPLKNLHDKKISYIEFLKQVKCYAEYKKWCGCHHVQEDENSAQLYFDHYGFEESSMVKEFIEPVS